MPGSSDKLAENLGDIKSIMNLFNANRIVEQFNNRNLFVGSPKDASNEWKNRVENCIENCSNCQNGYIDNTKFKTALSNCVSKCARLDFSFSS